MKQFLLFLTLLTAFVSNAAVTIDEICGDYEWKYESMLDWDGGTKTANITIAPHNNPKAVLIKGLYLDYNLMADVDFKTGDISIRNQSMDYDFSYGSLKIYKVVVEDGELKALQEPIVGHFEDGCIEFNPDELIGIGYPDYDENMFFLLAADNQFAPYVDLSFQYNPEEWEYMDDADFTDGWLAYHYLDGAWPTYQVRVEKNIKNPNLICVVNPFDNPVWIAHNQDFQAQGHIVMDIEDPTFVKIQTHVYSGFTDKEFGKLYMYSTDSHMLYVEGQSETAIRENLPMFVSTYKDGLITIPDPCFGHESRPVGYYGWNSVPATIQFLNTTGISAPAVDSSAAPAEYFDLQGRRVANPDRGIFIERRGADVRKVIR